jgi:hypothetical protein
MRRPILDAQPARILRQRLDRRDAGLAGTDTTLVP